MTTDLGVLTTAAEQWQSMAADLSKVEERYGETVQKITLGQNWLGFSVEAAQTKFATTRREYKSAQTEAKAVAKLLRDAHTGFADLKKKVESARDDAVAAGMAVSAAGRATFDFTRVQDPAQERTLRRDPDLKSVEESWTAHIAAAVRAMDEFDKAVKQALEAVVVDGNILDGTIGGFNASASPVIPPTGSARSEQKFTDAEKWIFEEMKRNAKSDTVGHIRSLLDEPEWYEFGRNYGSDINTALTMWGVKVAPGQDWDHKPQLQERYDLQTLDDYYFKQPGTNREVFYDIYSNVHYGYVGRAAGFDADTLIKGASLGETLLTGDDDQGDQITMRVGIDLYDKYGDNLTEEQLRQGINDAMDQMEQAHRNGENVPQVRTRK
ncbi:polymorphic toxin type 44 domain-containing protein [Streptomyces goshikiensis]|uniref:polymorphic toxin type 44 domain-containing protein n=1 Tax=Streptomyces TaxID=1883 RepID=UPI00202A6C74|nr:MULTISPECIES: polymorphic toxin type 44 domain-containing protein [unclassified Streptomyces]